MSGVSRTLLALGVLSGIVLGVLSTTTSLPRDTLLDSWILLAGALLLLGLVHATRAAGARADESLFERALRARHPQPGRPAVLEGIERDVAMSATTSFDLHMRFRPLLRAIAAQRLASGRGLALDEGSPETRELLGDDLWDLLRPDRDAPWDRLAPGLPVADQRTALDRIERI